MKPIKQGDVLIILLILIIILFSIYFYNRLESVQDNRHDTELIQIIQKIDDNKVKLDKIYSDIEELQLQNNEIYELTNEFDLLKEDILMLNDQVVESNNLVLDINNQFTNIVDKINLLQGHILGDNYFDREYIEVGHYINGMKLISIDESKTVFTFRGDIYIEGTVQHTEDDFIFGTYFWFTPEDSKFLPWDIDSNGYDDIMLINYDEIASMVDEYDLSSIKGIWLREYTIDLTETATSNYVVVNRLVFNED